MSNRHPDAFDRLKGTATLAGAAHEHWSRARIAVIGAGLLGGILVREMVRSGVARCDVYDPGVAEIANLGTQAVEPGKPKVETLARLCDDIAPGVVRPYQIDVLHVGEGRFESADLIVNCSDDPALEFPVSRLSCGWAIPALRLAVDGTGQRELGRVMVSHGGGGHACAICGASWRETFDAGPRTPCLGDRAAPAPTYAGSALAMCVAGFGLLCAKRLVGGNGADRVLDREFLVDLDHPQILSMALRRSHECLTGHERWSPIRLDRAADEITVRELVHAAAKELTRHHMDGPSPTHPEAVRVGLAGHPLLPSVMCTGCGEADLDVGTSLRIPACPRCGEAMQRRRDIAVDALTLEYAEAQSVADRTCASLGFPHRSALVQAHAPGTPAIHLLLP